MRLQARWTATPHPVCSSACSSIAMVNLPQRKPRREPPTRGGMFSETSATGGCGYQTSTSASRSLRVLERAERGVLARVIVAELVVDAEHRRRGQAAALDDEPFGEDDFRMRFGLRHRVADRLQLELDGVADLRARAVARDLNVE